MKSNEKGLNNGLKDPDAYVNAYSYEEIANILFGKWALIINNLCILFYLFSCQCSYMTLIKVKHYSQESHHLNYSRHRNRATLFIS